MTVDVSPHCAVLSLLHCSSLSLLDYFYFKVCVCVGMFTLVQVSSEAIDSLELELHLLGDWLLLRSCR